MPALRPSAIRALPAERTPGPPHNERTGTRRPGCRDDLPEPSVGTFTVESKRARSTGPTRRSRYVPVEDAGDRERGERVVIPRGYSGRSARADRRRARADQRITSTASGRERPARSTSTMIASIQIVTAMAWTRRRNSSLGSWSRTGSRASSIQRRRSPLRRTRSPRAAGSASSESRSIVRYVASALNRSSAAAVDDGVEARLGLEWGVGVEERCDVDFGVRADEQGVLVGEVAVGGRPGDRCGGGGRLDGWRGALGEQVAGGADQGLAGALLLILDDHPAHMRLTCS